MDQLVCLADPAHVCQIYISYGPKSNAELLLLYGFAVERNPFNSVDVTVSIAPRTESFIKEIANQNVTVDPLAEEKIAFLQSAGREKTVDFPCYADRYPIEMLEYLRLMQMTPEDTRYVGKRENCWLRLKRVMHMQLTSASLLYLPQWKAYF